MNTRAINSRRKGLKGQAEAKNLLRDRDWVVHSLQGGTSNADVIATDPEDKTWCVEIKRTTSITMTHRRQAADQAKKYKLPWMLMSHIADTSSWLIQRQGKRPTIWHNESKP